MTALPAALVLVSLLVPANAPPFALEDFLGKRVVVQTDVYGVQITGRLRALPTARVTVSRTPCDGTVWQASRRNGDRATFCRRDIAFIRLDASSPKARRIIRLRLLGARP